MIATSCNTQFDPSDETPNGSLWVAVTPMSVHPSPLLFEPIASLAVGETFLTLDSWGAMMPESTWLKVLTCHGDVGWIYTGLRSMSRVDEVIPQQS